MVEDRSGIKGGGGIDVPFPENLTPPFLGGDCNFWQYPDWAIFV